MSAFTLIELLTVIVIIAALSALVVGASKYALTKGARSRADAEIASMENALESFKSDNGYYPRSTQIRGNTATNSILLYQALATGPKQYFPFKPNQLQDGRNNIIVTILCTTNFSLTVTNVAIIDPFGRPYNYFTDPCGTVGRTNQATFDLWSNGPNGINDEGSSDDITNWKQN